MRATERLSVSMARFAGMRAQGHGLASAPLGKPTDEAKEPVPAEVDAGVCGDFVR